MKPTLTHITIGPVRIPRIAMLIIALTVLATLQATQLRMTAQTGTTMSGATTEENASVSSTSGEIEVLGDAIEESNASSMASSRADDAEEMSTTFASASGASASSQEVSTNSETFSSAMTTETAESSDTISSGSQSTVTSVTHSSASSNALETESHSSETTDPEQTDVLSSSAISSAVSSELAASSGSSAPSFTFELPAIKLVEDAAGSEHTPVLSIAKNATIQEISDVYNNLSLTLTGFGKTLATEIELREMENEIRINVQTPATFRPGDYTLHVSWKQDRSAIRFMEKMFDVIHGAEDAMLLEENIQLGMVAANADRDAYASGDTAVIRAAFTDGERALSASGVTKEILVTAEDVIEIASESGAVARVQLQIADDDNLLTMTRSAPARTSPNAEETMTITVTPKLTFIGSITESIPAGFAVETVTPLGNIQESNSETHITWNREFQANVPLQLSYTFTATPIAPLFAQFGPMEARGTVTGGVRDRQEVIEIEESSESSSAESSSAETTEPESDILETSASASSANQSSHSSAPAMSSLSSESVVTPPSSESGITSVEAASSVQESLDTATGTDLSWFRSFLAQLFPEQGSSFRFQEERRWGMLVLPAKTARTQRIKEVLQLKPHHNGSFDANTAPSFTLIDEHVTGEDADTLERNGTIKEEKALAAVVRMITDEAVMQEAVIADFIEEESEDFAYALTNDTDALNILLDGSLPRSLRRAATMNAEAGLKNEQSRKKAASIIKDDVSVQTALDTLLTEEMEQAIAEQAVRKQNNKTSKSVSKLLQESSDASTINTLSNAVVESVQAKKSTSEKIATAVIAHSATESKKSNQPVISLILRDASGKTFTPNYHFVPGSVVLVLEPERAFTPGLYSLEVTLYNPLTDEETVQTADFAWGVLAMNPSQDRYDAGDIIDLAIGVLDDEGRIVCDAELSLEISPPPPTPPPAGRGGTILLSTEDDSIETGSSCGLKEAGLIDPDYYTSFTAVEAGIYELTLTATTQNGTRSMTSTIEVNDPPFVIRRIGATRLWPLAPSPMQITITFHESVSGTITETVPAGFEISEIRPAAKIVQQADESQELRWKGSWEAGEQVTFRYLYDAPDISPQFYLLGPLRISSALPFFSAP